MLHVSTLFVVILASFCYADKLSDCKCWAGFEAKKSESGVKCFGTGLLHIMDCNEPERPDCKCSGEVSGKLSDASGMWCTQLAADGLKKWACENKEEWDKFFKKYPNEKP